jgi:hypothetical protein
MWAQRTGRRCPDGGACSDRRGSSGHGSSRPRRRSGAFLSRSSGGGGDFGLRIRWRPDGIRRLRVGDALWWVGGRRPKQVLAVEAEVGAGLAGDCCGRHVATAVAGHVMMTMAGDEQRAWEHGSIPSATGSDDFRP